MHKAILFVFLLLLGCVSAANAQLTPFSTYRVFAVNDSTAYPLNADTSLVAGRNRLYLQSSSGQTLIRDFTDANDTTSFINDFEMLTDSVWYVMTRSFYWGNDATLYKTLDQGSTWQIDSSYLPATQAAADTSIINLPKDVYQLQLISADTMLLFVGYYSAAIFYSVDAGANWQLWFHNQIVNYRGLLECGDDYYLWGEGGDGFSAAMFRFDGSLLLSPDTNDVWRNYNSTGHHPACYNGSPNCVYYGGAYPLTYPYFRAYADSICALPTAVATPQEPQPTPNLYPNPASDGVFYVRLPQSEPVEYAIFDALGRLVAQQATGQISDLLTIDLSRQSAGIYFLHLHSPQGEWRFKLLR